MYSAVLVGVVWGLVGPAAQAAPSSYGKRQSSCSFHSATSPTCWDGQFDITSDYYATVPTTNRPPQVYRFNLTSTTMSPDGVARPVFAINGQIPGPTIKARWGDTIEVHLTNHLEVQGTSLHFHGVRQHLTNDQDGVGSITQCPTAPGDTIVYTWKATQYGTSWYHSHFGVQAWDGVFGAIEIEGPASAPYDIDLGPVLLSDWTHQTAEVNYQQARTGDQPRLQNGLINGMNILAGAGGTTGKRFEMAFTKGKRHRLRLINTAVDTMYKVTLDQHVMTVIAADFVPVEPFQTKVLPIALGQRYDVIIEADQTNGTDFFLRAVSQDKCGGGNEQRNDIRAVVRYDATSQKEPTSTMAAGLDDAALEDCLDVPMASLVPVVKLDVPATGGVGSASGADFKKAVGLTQAEDGLSLVWTINDNTFHSDWATPTLRQVLDGKVTAEAYTPVQQVVALNDPGTFTTFVITTDGMAHPIHLHGHDFFILAQGSGTYTEDVARRTKNPPRRDVAMLPEGGYLVIAFQQDNPGAWLLHCHVGWHVSQGFALQLLEQVGSIGATVDQARLDATCSKWKDHVAKSGIVQDESGV